MKPLRIDRHSIVRTCIAEARSWWAKNAHNLRAYDKSIVANQRRIMGWHADTDPALLDAARPLATWSLCGGCGRRVAVVVRVGEPMDYDSATVDLCHDCVKEALNLIPEPVDVAP